MGMALVNPDIGIPFLSGPATLGLIAGCPSHITGNELITTMFADSVNAHQ